MIHCWNFDLWSPFACALRTQFVSFKRNILLHAIGLGKKRPFASLEEYIVWTKLHCIFSKNCNFWTKQQRNFFMISLSKTSISRSRFTRKTSAKLVIATHQTGKKKEQKNKSRVFGEKFGIIFLDYVFLIISSHCESSEKLQSIWNRNSPRSAFNLLFNYELSTWFRKWATNATIYVNSSLSLDFCSIRLQFFALPLFSSEIFSWFHLSSALSDSTLCNK